MTHPDETEIRFLAPNGDVAILDGVCHATGNDRTGVMRLVLQEWAARELHRATVVLRVARGNPAPAATERKEGGT